MQSPLDNLMKAHGSKMKDQAVARSPEHALVVERRRWQVFSFQMPSDPMKPGGGLGEAFYAEDFRSIQVVHFAAFNCCPKIFIQHGRLVHLVYKPTPRFQDLCTFLLARDDTCARDEIAV